ncbi:hypothetical protein [Aeromonas taiwanensis]|uniref:hypothetical protein n=1 Tax=Aeromonas taiwanensis TaxID=633417 RepID=UPI003CD0C499
MNNSLTRRANYEGLTTMPADACVTLMNPLSADLNVMRQTLLFGGLQTIAHNINHKQRNLRFFEFGQVGLTVRDELQIYFAHQPDDRIDRQVFVHSEQPRSTLT